MFTIKRGVAILRYCFICVRLPVMLIMVLIVIGGGYAWIAAHGLISIYVILAIRSSYHLRWV